MKAVLDTNVLISSVIATGIPHKVVLKGFRGEFQIVVSVPTLTEFRETLLKYPDRFGLDDEEVQREVETIFKQRENPAVHGGRESRHSTPRTTSNSPLNTPPQHEPLTYEKTYLKSDAS